MRKIITDISLYAFAALFLFNHSTVYAACNPSDLLGRSDDICYNQNQLNQSTVYTAYNPSDVLGRSDDICCNQNHFWGEAEYLYWWVKNSPEPVPLVVTGPAVDNFDPILNEPGTSVVLGGSDIKNHARSGGRFTLGYWFCDDQAYGAEVSYLFLGSSSKSQSVSSNGELGSDFLAFPFLDAVTGLESSSAIARAGDFSGLATLKIKNKMQGAELNGLFTIASCSGYHVRGLVGFRYWNFDEQLTFATDSPFINPPIDVYTTEDRFSTRNNFYGGQIGIDMDYSWCKFFVNVKGKVALGAMNEKVKIQGLLTTNDFNNFGEPQTFPSGYLVQSTNSGSHSKTQFAVIPELDINLGYQISDCLSVSVGYTFLYVSNMLWAGKQIDREINPTQSPAMENDPAAQLVGVERPTVLHDSSHFWAQGLNVGVDYHF